MCWDIFKCKPPVACWGLTFYYLMWVSAWNDFPYFNFISSSNEEQEYSVNYSEWNEVMRVLSLLLGVPMFLFLSPGCPETSLPIDQCLSSAPVPAAVSFDSSYICFLSLKINKNQNKTKTKPQQDKQKNPMKLSSAGREDLACWAWMLLNQMRGLNWERESPGKSLFLWNQTRLYLYRS